MNYVLTNNPKMLIQHSSSHSSSIHDRPSCSGLLFTLIFSLLINVFVRFRSKLLFLGARILSDSLQCIVHIVAQNKWIRKIFDPFLRWRIQENIQTNKQSDSTLNAFGLIYYDVLLAGQPAYENKNKWLCTLRLFKFPWVITEIYTSRTDINIEMLVDNEWKNMLLKIHCFRS